MQSDEDSPNQQLYRDGRRYDRLVTSGSIVEVVRLHKVSVADVRTAIAFASDVDRITQLAGKAGKTLILSGKNPLLTPVLISRLAKLGADRLMVALSLAAEGWHPLGPRPTPDRSAELNRWDFEVERLNRVHGYLQRALESSNSPSASAEHGNPIIAQRHAEAVRAFSEAILLGLIQSVPVQTMPSDQLASLIQNDLSIKTIATARKIMADVTHDILLLAHFQPPSRSVAKTLIASVRQVTIAATQICGNAEQAVRTRGGPSAIDDELGPKPERGTYIIVMHLSRPTVLRIGRLETFWLPAGYLLYVGSAFGPGGVRNRSARHLTLDAPRLWNIDYLKGFAKPLELWWTHSSKRVECHWAMALAELRGYCCPAPRCGGNDCKCCPAHLLHSARQPSCEDFGAQVNQMIPGLGPVYRKRL